MRLTVRQMPFVIEVGMKVVAIDLALRIVSPRKLIDRLSRVRRHDVSLARLTPIVLGWERRIFGGASCLRGALTVFWIAGPKATLHLGMKSLDEAHAWVQSGEEIFPPRTLPGEYALLAAFGKRA